MAMIIALYALPLAGYCGGPSMPLGWFYGLSVVPVAEATALSFTAVIFASLGATLFLGEVMKVRGWLAVAAGFAGVLIILRPSPTNIDAGALLVLGSSVAWGLSVVAVRKLTQTDSVVSIVAWFGIMLTILSTPPALLVWQTPSGEQILWLAAIGVLATLGHLAMAKALQLAEATVIMPVDFMRLLWASFIGFWALGETPDVWTWVGGGTIVAAAAYIIVGAGRRGHGPHT